MTQSTKGEKVTKSALLRRMLQGRAGASVNKLCEATGWQQHSIRAALSSLRKTGFTIERRAPAKPGAEARYRITGKPGAA